MPRSFLANAICRHTNRWKPERSKMVQLNIIKNKNGKRKKIEKRIKGNTPTCHLNNPIDKLKIPQNTTKHQKIPQENEKRNPEFNKCTLQMKRKENIEEFVNWKVVGHRLSLI